jgi:hypothetical protein
MKTIPTEYRNLCMAEAIDLMDRDDHGGKSHRRARWARRKNFKKAR